VQPADGENPTAASERPGARWLENLAAAVAACVLTLVLWARTDEITLTSQVFRMPGDDHTYLYMASQPVGSFHIAPWSWRILVPALVRWLPFGPQAGFELIALASVAITGLVVYLILRKWGFAISLSAIGMVLYFSMGYATKFNIKDFWLTDSTAFLFASAGILALQYRKRYAFAACLLLGVLAKESAIFIAPLYYTFEARKRWDRAALARTLLAALPALAALAIMRVTIPAWNSDHAYVASLPQAVRSDIVNLPTYNMLNVAHDAIVGRSHFWLATLEWVGWSFGLLGIAAPVVGWYTLKPMLLRFWPLLLGDLSQLAFALNTPRLLVFGFVPVIIACLLGAREIETRLGVHRAWIALAAATAFALELASPTATAPGRTLQLEGLGAVAVLAALSTWWRRAHLAPASRAGAYHSVAADRGPQAPPR
jgi:hypothetical protein